MQMNKMAVRGIAMAVAILLAGCGGSQKLAKTSPTAPKAPAPAVAAANRVEALIAEADRHLAKGMDLSKEGQMEEARAEFDAATDLYLAFPGGALSDQRLAESFRRTVEAIHEQEVAVADNDSAQEEGTEPAAIDEVGQMPLPEGGTGEATRRAAQDELADTPSDFPVQLNERVYASIGLYQGRLKEWMQAALTRGAPYIPHIQSVFRENGIPQDLAYVALVESAFHPSALSRAKAKGVWQFIAGTGRMYGLKQDYWVDERSDPFKATAAAAKYLKTLYGIFGDWNLALAGYNAGEGRVLRAMAKTGTSDYWSLTSGRALRSETRNYVPLIQAAILIGKSPERYGFNFEPQPLPAFETVPVDGSYELRFIADCADSDLDTVRGLNPELRRMLTPASRTYDVRVPAGTTSAVGDCIASAPSHRRVQLRTHEVTRGQTLASIARRYGTSTRELAAANGISSRTRLRAGTDLVIPGTTRVARAVPTSRRTSTASASAANASDEGRAVRYRIKPGDTLTSIASQYGTSVARIKDWNNIKGTRIAAGTLLTIYPR
jgi:membrane-bound lytic murein transglycosylase D